MSDLPEKARVTFRLIPESEFSWEHLEEYPAWSEYYDYDEREEIVEWGIDAAWLEEEIERKHDGSNHAMYPLLQTNPLPPRMRIYLRARFRTPNGQSLSGYVINDDAYCIGIFVGGRQFTFNWRHGDNEWTRRDRATLQRLLPDPGDPLFPLFYETDFMDEDGRRIEGTFAFEAA
jgi:hypothetical protein